jgi:FtsP/CotA-like multicopper oxidase with cupredoxin domain
MQIRTILCAAIFWTMIAPAIAAAEELRQPEPPLPTGVVADPPLAPGCTPLSAEGRVRPARLIVRNSDRHDVGPYTVTLPGYATDDDPAKDRYAPFVIEAAPGDTLRIDLINQLPDAWPTDAIINLHTHGLIVSPRPVPARQAR